MEYVCEENNRNLVDAGGAHRGPLTAMSRSARPYLRPAVSAMRVALIVAGAFFMENLDGVIVTALPQIGHSFQVTATDLSLRDHRLSPGRWPAFIPISGWAADRFGLRTVFVSAQFCLFTVASALCGLAPPGSGASSPPGCCRGSPPP